MRLCAQATSKQAIKQVAFSGRRRYCDLCATVLWPFSSYWYRQRSRCRKWLRTPASAVSILGHMLWELICSLLVCVSFPAGFPSVWYGSPHERVRNQETSLRNARRFLSMTFLRSMQSLYIAVSRSW